MEDLVQNERYSRMWKWSLDISDEYSRFKGTIFHYQLQTHSTTYPAQYLFMFSINLQAFYHEDINFICIWKDEKTPRISLSRKLVPVQHYEYQYGLFCMVIQVSRVSENTRPVRLESRLPNITSV